MKKIEEKYLNYIYGGGRDEDKSVDKDTWVCNDRCGDSDPCKDICKDNKDRDDK